MIDLSFTTDQIHVVSTFEDLVSKRFQGQKNAACWSRKLLGNFQEIVEKIELDEDIKELGQEELHELELTEEGQLAREILLKDLSLLEAHGASPILNVIKSYERDTDYSFFPRDVYSFHVDRSPIPTDTFLCTYYGASSEILPNAQATQKILIPEIRNKLKMIYTGKAEDFETFLIENFFDLHYAPKPKAQTINLGLGHLWRLTVDHPEREVLPCVHAAPTEKIGEPRLLLIC